MRPDTTAALKELRAAIKDIDTAGGIYVTTEHGSRRLGGRYVLILGALRKFIDRGGKPFQDPTFTNFFQELLRERSIEVFEYRDISAAPKGCTEEEEFARKVLRLCGAELQPDGIWRFSARLKQIGKHRRKN